MSLETQLTLFFFKIFSSCATLGHERPTYIVVLAGKYADKLKDPNFVDMVMALEGGQWWCWWCWWCGGGGGDGVGGVVWYANDDDYGDKC